MTQPHVTDAEPPQEVPVARLVLFWLIAGVPLAWGVVQTVLKALPLFSGGAGPGH
ncbi:hypothetical protein Dcar01_02639 [Deinococcus carri]|uniref:Oxalate:formate antiporter n=1 Tax=Deinococcus carri TaxID=1211323 RepID=A0ABP9WBQ1_9DEIO